MFQPSWIPRSFFVFTVATAGALLGGLVLAPVLLKIASERFATSRLVVLFAEDITVRRTVLASGVGLLVTACVFFRCPSKYSHSSNRPNPPMMGA